MDIGDSRLVLVANRLPVTVQDDGDSNWKFNPSTGGLAAGLRGLAQTVKFEWWGWPGIDVREDDKAKLRQLLMDQHHAVPVFVNSTLAQRHYNGFSNSVLWPLLHSIPEKMSFDESASQAYREVNRIFADAMAPELKNGDLIWIHDYHLMLLPAMLRERVGDKNIKIGFFLHTPFPSTDFFTILPIREEILHGLLSCDLVGFHTEEYAQHFHGTCMKILNAKETEDGLHYNQRNIRIMNFPLGIEPQDFQQLLENKEVKDIRDSLKQAFQDKVVMIGVDRMDYIKGVPQKMRAFDRFLEDNPQWKERVILLQLAVPSRPDVEAYQQLRTEINRLVGEVNGRHGTATYVPIHFMHKSISQEELAALYTISDVCLVSSTRDGLNLVSYEFVACQDEKAGLLVISKFTGAAEILPDCLVINPWDIEETSHAIKRAVEMDPAERRRRHDANSKTVKQLTSLYWGKTFLQMLKDSNASKSDKMI